MAGVADVYADVRDFRRRIKRHLRLSLFSARWAINPSKSPFVRAEHANQRLFPTVAFAPQYADDRLAAAKRAGGWSSIYDRDLAVVGKILGIRLKKNPRKQLIGKICFVRIASLGKPGDVRGRSQFRIPVPEIFDRLLPSRRSLLRQLNGSLGQRHRCNLLDDG